MENVASKQLTELLGKWEKGDRQALNELLPLTYDELRQAAHRCLNRERPNHTLQSSALVHEAYLRLSRQRPRHFENRNHFISVAARLMRYILVDYARNQRAVKRGAGALKLQADEGIISPQKDVDLLALEEALTSLQEADAEQARLVELRFFAGLSVEEASEILHISPATLKRRWTSAKAYLYQHMRQ